jgi:hypothetical protein
MLLALLVGASFSPGDALHVYRAYFGFLNGHVSRSCKRWSPTPGE